MTDQTPHATTPDLAYLAHVERLRIASLSGAKVLAPDGLWLAITQNCNFKCVGCWREGLFSKTYVSVQDVTRMLADSAGHAYQYISLTTGEAFLHPQVCDIIEACRAAHPQAVIDVISNGSIAPRGRFAEAIGMIDHLGLSIDGARAETFESIRRGGSFDRFLQHTAEIVAIRKATGFPKQLGFSFTAMTRNIAELPDVVRIAADLGVPLVYAQPMEMAHPDIVARVGAEHISHMPIDQVYAITDEARALGQALGVQVDLAGYLDRHGAAEEAGDVSDATLDRDIRQCQYPYLKPFQFVRTGDRFRALLCCYMVETAADLAAERYGMDYDQAPGVLEFYNSPAFWRFRTDLAQGKAGDLCGRCLQARTYPWESPE